LLGDADGVLADLARVACEILVPPLDGVDDALDVLQETFGYLIGKLPHLTLTAKMTTFLYPVVKNLSLRLRERQRLTLLEPETLDQLPAPARRDDHLARRDLTAVLEELPVEQREVVWLRFVDGMRLKEISKLLQLPMGTVKSRLHYAIAALRRDARVRHYFLDDTVGAVPSAVSREDRNWP